MIFLLKFFQGWFILNLRKMNLALMTFTKCSVMPAFTKEETGGQNEIPAEDITVSLVREGKPEALIKYLSGKCKVVEKSPGIYRVEGLLFPMQILVTGKLDLVLHTWLCSLTRSLKKEEAESLLNNYSVLENTGDRKNAGVIVNFVSNVNNELFLKIAERNGRMTEELKILLAPEIVDLRATIKKQAETFAQKESTWMLERSSFTKREADFSKREAELLKEIEELKKNQSRNI